ncbi:MAG TPA: glycosyltransferase family 1 protein [Thermoanaerobaculia bacterium]|nr:glycosyltransferase family 1 protein [Thermoanaerobaculia bacterium]
MRIAIDGRKIADFGIGTYIQGLLRGISRSDADHHFVILLPRPLRRWVPDDPRFACTDLESPHYSLRELRAVARAIDRSRVDLFHAPHYVVPFTSRPVVVTIHDLTHLVVRHPNPLARPYASWMIGRAATISRRVLTVSRATADELLARYPDIGAKLTVTPNGVAEEFFDPPAGSALEELAALGLASGRYLLTVGNDKPHKNLDRLVAAFRRAPAHLEGVSLVFAGSAPARFENIEGVRLLGSVSFERLRALYARALAVVQPSAHEGFGLPVLEAMAGGAPVIASSIAAHREVAGDAALMIDPSSIDSMSAAMIRIFDDEDLRQQMSERGRIRARGWSWTECASATLRAYGDAIGAPRDVEIVEHRGTPG